MEKISITAQFQTLDQNLNKEIESGKLSMKRMITLEKNSNLDQSIVTNLVIGFNSQVQKMKKTREFVLKNKVLFIDNQEMIHLMDQIIKKTEELENISKFNCEKSISLIKQDILH